MRFLRGTSAHRMSMKRYLSPSSVGIRPVNKNSQVVSLVPNVLGLMPDVKVEDAVAASPSGNGV